MSLPLYENASLATAYSKFRPKPPAELINYIISYLNEKLSPPFKSALDVGCGTGQNAGQLSPYFQQVEGVDISSTQIEAAKRTNQWENVSYRVGTLETLAIPSESVALVACSLSFHWLDAEIFFKESRRILEPNGVIALYGYKLPTPYLEDCAKELESLVTKIYNDAPELHPYRSACRKLVDSGYQDVIIPLSDFRRTSFDKEWTQSVADYIGYISSWSGYQAFKKDDPEGAEKLLKNFEHEFLEILKEDGSPEEINITVKSEFFLLLGRKEV